MKWFRFYTEIVDDPKMRALKDDEYRIFTYLLSLASEIEKEGLIDLSIDDISWRLRAPMELIERTIEALKRLGILSANEDGFEFVNWQKRQFKSDDVATRVRKHREKKVKQGETLHETLQGNKSETLENRTEQSRTETEQSKGDSVPLCPHKDIVTLYHEILPELPQVKSWTEERQKTLRARWREDPKRQNVEWWKGFFKYVRKSAFLLGENDRGWQPNLEWLVTKSHFVDITEGKYHEDPG